MKAIAELDLMIPPGELQNRIYDSPSGVYGYIDRIRIPSTLPDIEVIHVLPDTVEGKDCIDFESYATVAEDRGEIGKRFAASLRSWSAIEAEDRWPDSVSARLRILRRLPGGRDRPKSRYTAFSRPTLAAIQTVPGYSFDCNSQPPERVHAAT